EEAGDEVTARALGRAGAVRVEGTARDGALQVAVHLAFHTGLDGRAVLAAADDVGARIGAGARAGLRDEATPVLTTDGVGAVVVAAHLVDAVQRAGRPRPEVAAVLRRRHVEDEDATLRAGLVLARVGKAHRGERQRADDEHGEDQPSFLRIWFTP